MGWFNSAITGALPGVQFLTAGLSLYLAYSAYKAKPKSNREQLSIDSKFRADRAVANAYNHLGYARAEERTPVSAVAH
jgi:hypothetical protein